MSLPKLTDTEIQEHLPRLPGWNLDGNAIRKQYAFPTFIQAMRFVNEIAENAEAVNHHPDIDIRYNKVVLTLSTHDSAGITKNDIQFAAATESVADSVSP